MEKPIERRKLSDEIFDRLKTKIFDGTLSNDGLVPSERELMAVFGVGRPAIREALQRLEHHGLITIVHGERARIAHPDETSIFRQIDLPTRILLASSETSLQHLIEARKLFERGLIRVAAERATKSDIDSLAAKIADQRATLSDIPQFIQCDMSFHIEIARITGNPLLYSVAKNMLGWLETFHVEMLHWSGKENVTIVEHEDILEALAQRDPDAAEQAMVRHLDRSADLFVHPHRL
ncbi:transcriptional regulator NanR [Gluconobacter oxydans]|uniref:transcriptional regulator NanR n=1 Tax=Gluconobacter oxydans TaxID=442 RepID=UPI001CD8C4A9